MPDPIAPKLHITSRVPRARSPLLTSADRRAQWPRRCCMSGAPCLRLGYVYANTKELRSAVSCCEDVCSSTLEAAYYACFAVTQIARLTITSIPVHASCVADIVVRVCDHEKRKQTHVRVFNTKTRNIPTPRVDLRQQ